MKKTSVYLGDLEIEQLERLARLEGTSKAEVIRRAILTYSRQTRDRNLSLAHRARGPGTSVADIPERELLEELGES